MIPTANGPTMKTLLAAAILLAGLAAPALCDPYAPMPLEQSKTYPDGAVVTAYVVCRSADLCASIKLPSGDEIDVYSTDLVRDGAIVNVVRRHGSAVLASYQDTIDNRYGERDFDYGAVRVQFKVSNGVLSAAIM